MNSVNQLIKYFHKILRVKINLILLLALVTIVHGQSTLPKAFSLNSQKIYSLREAYVSGELKNEESFKSLKKQADKLLNMTPLSVMDKNQTPPSGDKHDYTSMGKYWWPNPNKKDGLPYINKDGLVNPEALDFKDVTSLNKMISAVKTLSLAYYISNIQAYSIKAAQLLRVWFINENSKMNPNLNYAQFVPGVNKGSKSGIIEVNKFYQLIDAVGLLENSKEWTNEDDIKIKKWFDDFLNWLRTSKNGQAESKAKNNHGAWYDVKIVSISLFLGKTEFAKQYLIDALTKRIAVQIKNDGAQPLELKRTKSWGYSLYNLQALFRLAMLGDHVGIDLWNYTNDEGGSLRKALDFILPSAVDIKLWQYPQIEDIKKNELYPLLIIAKKKYDEKVYSNWIQKIYGDKIKNNIEDLL